MFCPRCGLKLNDFDAFCPRCGTQVRESDYPPPEPRPEFAPPKPQAPQRFAPTAQQGAMPSQGAFAPQPPQPQGAFAPQPPQPPQYQPAQPPQYQPPQPAQPRPGAYTQATPYRQPAPTNPQAAQYPQPNAYPQPAPHQQPGAYPPPQYPAQGYPQYPTQSYPQYPMYPAYPYAQYPAARPVAPPKPPDPNAKMKRAFNLSALSTLVVLGTQSVILEVAVSIIGVIVGLWFALTGRASGSFDLRELLGSVMNDTPAMFVALTVHAVIYSIGMIGGIKISDLIRRRVDVAPIEKKKMSAGRMITVILICFGVWGLGVIIGNVGNFVAPTGSESFGWASIPEWLLAIVAAPLFEETIFRKFLLDRLHPFGERTAVIFSALVFGMAHQNGMQFFLAFFIGIVFAIVYLRTGKLIYTMLLHFMINLVATSDEVGCLIFGDEFDIWWMVVCTALTVGGIVTLIAVLARRDEFFRLAPNTVEGANRAAFRPWGSVLARVLAIVYIAGYGVFFVWSAYSARNGALSFVHLVPAVAAIITILVVSKKTGSKAVAVAAPVAYAAPVASAPIAASASVAAPVASAPVAAYAAPQSFDAPPAVQSPTQESEPNEQE